ncbi:MAG: radical SAM protein [Candidatus Sericytochromatia bacterium]|nr:radical SAM protein [Candidatus Sericytochromatia bacterium]
MHLCLVNPPEMPGFVSDRDKAGGVGVARPYQRRLWNRYCPPTPALDLLYALALADRAGIPNRFVDAIARRWNARQTLAAICETNPTHVGVRISLPSLKEDLALANAVVTALPRAQVFLFGACAKMTHSRWLGQFRGDAVLYGEVEALLLAYLDGQAERAVLRPPQSATPASWQTLENLDSLPFPAWHRVDRAAYTRRGHADDFVYYVLTSRGCPKGCAMCPYFVYQGAEWRARSLDHLAAEFAHLANMGARRVQTRDPNISWRKPHLMALAERLAGQRQLAITTETDLEALNRQDLERLREAGFVRIMTGVESVDETILRDIHQNGQALKRVLVNMQTCAELGIAVTGFFIVGALTETWQSIRQTIATARTLPCEYSVSLMTPYPGTESREAFIKAGYHREGDFRDYNGYTGLVRTSGLDHQQVVLAHAWASAELELVQRRRGLHWRHWWQTLRYLAQRHRVTRLRRRIKQVESLAPATTHREELPLGA